MTFQAYLDTIRERTGKGPDDFRKLAEKRGYLRADAKASEIVAWLKSEFGLGHGHAMAIYGVLRSSIEAPTTQDERIAEHFRGKRKVWSDTYKKLLSKAKDFGNDRLTVKAGNSYLSLLRNGKKFAILKVGVDFLDIGIKIKKGARESPRLQHSGDWNTMVTHRVRLDSPKDFDAEVTGWLKAAYDAA